MPSPICVALWEMKCPHGRLPTGDVPTNYVPQLWSGLMVCDQAAIGLFCDAGFRKCTLEDLGLAIERGAIRGDASAPDGNYDRKYSSRKPAATKPQAWGVVALIPNKATKAGAAAAKAALREGVFDVGGAPTDEFDDYTAAVAAGTYRAVPLAPWLAAPRLVRHGPTDDLRMANGREGAVAGSAALPEGTTAVIPWKLFDWFYAPVERNPRFEAEFMPRVAAVHAAVEAALRGDAVPHLGNEVLEPIRVDNDFVM